MGKYIGKADEVLGDKMRAGLGVDPLDKSEAYDNPVHNTLDQFHATKDALRKKISRFQARIFSDSKDWTALVIDEKTGPLIMDYPVGAMLAALHP